MNDKALRAIEAAEQVMDNEAYPLNASVMFTKVRAYLHVAEAALSSQPEQAHANSFDGLKATPSAFAPPSPERLKRLAEEAAPAPAKEAGTPFTVRVVYGLEDLPEWVDRDSLSRYASYLLIEHGEYKVCYSDAMEPEDARFGRDLKWIQKELERAAGQAAKGGREA